MELDAIYSSREIDGRSRPSRGEISPPTTRHVVGREKEDTVLRRVSFKLFASFFTFFFFFFYSSSIMDVFRF